MKAMKTPNRIVPVAGPRRQPRRDSLLTPGSMASDRNSDMARRTTRSLSFDQNTRSASVARAPVQKIAVAGMTQRGIRDGESGPGDADASGSRPDSLAEVTLRGYAA